MSDQEATALLAQRLETDPNGALCQTIVGKLNKGDFNAFREHMDRPALVERAIAAAPSMTSERASAWRRGAETIDNLSLYMFPKSYRFFCLGTFDSGDGAPVLMIRYRDSGSFGHLLLRLGGSAQRPMDDYLLSRSGAWQSEFQTSLDAPELRQYASHRERMLMISYEKKYDEIIEIYDALPEELRQSSQFFFHYISALMTVTVRGQESTQPRFVALEDSIQRFFKHPVARAYWLFIYYGRLGKTAEAEAQIRVLTEPYQDPIASDLRDWLQEHTKGPSGGVRRHQE